MKKIFLSFVLITLCQLGLINVNAQLYFEDSFGSYTAGTPLHGKGGWIIQNEPTEGYMVLSTNPLTYGSLSSDANYMIGGYQFFAAGLNFPVTAGELLYTNHVSDANPLILGYRASGSNVLWYSMLVRPEGEDHLFAEFNGARGPMPWWDGQWNFAISRRPWSHEWGIVVDHDDRRYSSTSTEVGEVALIVAKFEFEPDGVVISLFVNPALGTTPVTPTISAKTTSEVGFNAMQLYPGFNQNAYTLDEIRLGETFADVTPQSITTIISNRDTKTKVFNKGGVLVVDLTQVSGAANIQIYNMEGALVKSIESNGGEIKNIAAMPKGAYLVKVKQAGNVSTKKVLL